MCLHYICYFPIVPCSLYTMQWGTLYEAKTGLLSGPLKFGPTYGHMVHHIQH